MRSMKRRRLVRSSRVRASVASAAFGFGWTSAAGRAVVVAISSPSSARRGLRRQSDSSSVRCTGSPRGTRLVAHGTCGGGVWARLDGSTLIPMSTAGGFWARRLRWRLIGAWRWPIYVAVTILDAAIVNWLPPNGTEALFVPALVISSFANLFLIGPVAPWFPPRPPAPP